MSDYERLQAAIRSIEEYDGLDDPDFGGAWVMDIVGSLPLNQAADTLTWWAESVWSGADEAKWLLSGRH